MKRLEHQSTQLGSARDRQVRIVGHVREAVEIGDFAVQHIPHEEMLGQTHPAQFREFGDGLWTFHGVVTLSWLIGWYS